MIGTRKFHVILFLSCIVPHVICDSSTVCQIDIIRDLHPQRPPMILCRSDADNKYIHPIPIDPRSLFFGNNQEFKIYCPQKPDTKFQNNEATTPLMKDKKVLTRQTGDPIPIKCIGDNKFILGKEEVTLKSLSCENIESPLIVKLPEISCGTLDKDDSVYEIRYKIGKRHNLGIIKLCHNKLIATTLWARGIVRPIRNLYYNFINDDIPYKKGSDFAVSDMSTDGGPYSIQKQMEEFKKIFGEKIAQDHLSEKMSEKKYLSRGELISHRDLFYPSEQLGSLYYMNVVPIWETIRIGSWKFIEKYIRKLAVIKKHELDIWAGGIDLVRFNNGKQTLIAYLENLPKEKHHIPIPKIIFKCAMDKKAKEGMCFLIVNYPYVKDGYETAKGLISCPIVELCHHQVFQNEDKDSGYGFCCELEHFRSKYQKRIGLEGFQEEYLGYGTMELHDPNDMLKILK